MKSNKGEYSMLKIQYLIYVYMALCACMMIYNIVYTIYNRTTERNIEKQRNGFIKKIRNQFNLIENRIEIVGKHKEYLYNKLKWVHNLLLFEQLLDEQKENVRKKYLEDVKYVFYDLAIYYQKTDSVKKAYFAYIIGKYKIEDTIDKNIITNTLFMFLEDEAMYCRDNSLKAIIKLGNIYHIIKAFKEINQDSHYYSVELLYEDLLEFDGNQQRLAEQMWQEFHAFNENTQITIMKWISKYKLDYSEEFYKLLEDENISNKIKIEVTKYFKDNIFEIVEPLLIQNAKLTGILNRELVIQSAKTLGSYNSLQVKETLKSLLKRNDWDIRVAASESLSILGTSYYELAEIYNGEDNIARRILKYKIQSYKYTYTNQKKEVS